MNKFLKWWKVWGQVWGFLLIVISLNVLIFGFEDLMRTSDWLGVLWLVMFFGGAAWYAWQMRVHGWKLPEDIRRTH